MHEILGSIPYREMISVSCVLDSCGFGSLPTAMEILLTLGMVCCITQKTEWVSTLDKESPLHDTLDKMEMYSKDKVRVEERGRNFANEVGWLGTVLMGRNGYYRVLCASAV